MKSQKRKTASSIGRSTYVTNYNTVEIPSSPRRQSKLNHSHYQSRYFPVASGAADTTTLLLGSQTRILSPLDNETINTIVHQPGLI